MDGIELPAIPVAGRLSLSWKILSLLSFLVIVVWYSFLVIDAVDQVQASPQAMSSSFAVERDQLWAYCLVWTLCVLANSPRLFRSAAQAIRHLDWLRFGPKLASFLGFLITVRYSFLIIHAVDQVRLSPPAMSSSSSSFKPEQERLLEYCLAWNLGFLAMLLPPLITDSPSLMRLAARAINSLFPVFFDEHT